MHPHDGRVVSNFIVQALRNAPITIYGDGSQTRSFCYVSDLIDCMLLFMNSREDFTGPMNMGNPGEFTIRELAETVKDISGSSSKIVYQPLPKDDPVRRRPDISLATRELNWQPQIQLRQGLVDTIAYFDALLKNADIKL